MNLGFRTFYIQEAIDRVNEAEAELHVDGTMDEIIASVNKIKEARAELKRRKAEQFKDADAYIKHYENELKTRIGMLGDSENTARIIALCDKICKANVKLYNLL
jgi:hypothetical protein